MIFRGGSSSREEIWDAPVEAEHSLPIPLPPFLCSTRPLRANGEDGKGMIFKGGCSSLRIGRNSRSPGLMGDSFTLNIGQYHAPCSIKLNRAAELLRSTPGRTPPPLTVVRRTNGCGAAGGFSAILSRSVSSIKRDKSQPFSRASFVAWASRRSSIWIVICMVESLWRMPLSVKRTNRRQRCQRSMIDQTNPFRSDSASPYHHKKKSRIFARNSQVVWIWLRLCRSGSPWSIDDFLFESQRAEVRRDAGIRYS